MADRKAIIARERAIDLGRTGGIDSVVERLRREGYTVGRSTVARWIAAWRKVSARGAVANPAPLKADPLPPHLAKVDVAALDTAELEQLEGEVRTFREKARKRGDERMHSQLVRLTVELKSAIAKLRPPPVLDPQTDPANVEAGRIVVARLDAMIAEAERDPRSLRRLVERALDGELGGRGAEAWRADALVALGRASSQGAP